MQHEAGRACRSVKGGHDTTTPYAPLPPQALCPLLLLQVPTHGIMPPPLFSPLSPMPPCSVVTAACPTG